MAGLPWYAIWQDFSRHSKTRDLCGRVKDRNAGMYVIRLFEHCAEQALDGRIPAHSMEEAAGWRGKPGALLAALEAAKVVDVDGDVRVVHGWVERNGSRIEKWMRDNAKPRGNRKGPPGGPVRDQRGTGAGPAGEDVRSETLQRSRSAVVQEPNPCSQPPADRVREAGGGRAREWRRKLASALGLPRLGVGQNPERVVASFGRWLDRGLVDELVDECVRLAREKGVTPGHLSWWPGWLDTVPDEELDAAASQKRAGGAA